MTDNRTHTAAAAAKMIRAGERLFVAGDEKVLDSLPKGNWIGGTIPYFMDPEGGVTNTERVFVTPVPAAALDVECVSYGPRDVGRVASDSPDHGFTMLIVPAFSKVHRVFAENAPEYPETFMKPVLGWVSGVLLEKVGIISPKVFLGPTGDKFSERAAAMHVSLPPTVGAHIDIVNPFKQGSGPVLQFPETGFSARDCLIDGKPGNLALFVAESGIDTRLPLVADFCGAMINTSISGIDERSATASFYAPVFPGVAYRFADPIGDYATEFERRLPKDADIVFSCNCILNYLYGEMEGKPCVGAAGPITFGEIAYQLLNQTLVYLELIETNP